MVMRVTVAGALATALLVGVASGAAAAITYHDDEESFMAAYVDTMRVDITGGIGERQLLADIADFVFPLSAGVEVVRETIEVGPGQVYDGENKRYVMLDTAPTVPLMRVREGATVKNMVVGRRGGAGINVFGSCTIENVYFRNVGAEPAIRVSSAATQPLNLTIVGGGARNADDEGIQVNAPATVEVNNFVFDTLRTGVYICESCKKTKGAVRVTVDNSFARFRSAARRFAGATLKDGGDNQVVIKNLDVLALGDRDIPLCEGPPGLCIEE